LHLFLKKPTIGAKFGDFIMVRISKQQERRQRSPKKRRAASPKTGSMKDNLSLGYKSHANALEGVVAESFFIPKIK